MKVLIWSNAPWCATGYGQQTAQLTKRLKADGHEVGVVANWGLTGAPMDADGIKVYPQGAHPYSLDVADAHASMFFGDDPGPVIVLYDTWPLLEQPDLFAKRDAYYWAPIDHAPPPPKVQDWCSKHNVIAMAEFGREQLTAVGMPPAYTIPHAIERVYQPTESDARERLGVPEDAHLTAIVMANIGQVPIPRKCWFENLLGWRMFADKHDDAYIYIHTQLRHPRGVDLASMIQMWGLPGDRVRIVDQAVYAAGVVVPDQLAAIYSAADVTLMATAGEGFGLPAIESQACGTPVIGTDFSAQKEVIEAGWKVPFVTLFDYTQGATQALPDVRAIASALEESYTVSRDPEAAAELGAKAIAHAAQYDADRVYAEHWRPFMADRAVKPNRAQRRRKNRAA